MVLGFGKEAIIDKKAPRFGGLALPCGRALCEGEIIAAFST